MALTLEQAVELVQEDLEPLKVRVSLLIEDHTYYVQFTNSITLTPESYWETYWGMTFGQLMAIWTKKYFSGAELDEHSANTVRFRLGTLLDFLKESK